MTLRIANVDFDQYDETPEGHAVRFDADGRLIGITLVNARRLIDSQGRIRITLPETIAAAEIARALAGP